MDQAITALQKFLPLLLFLGSGCSHEPVMPPATACFQLMAEQPLAGQELVFENCALGAERYEWDFGDGTISNDPQPLHQYQKEGRYKVVQRVYSDDAYDMRYDSVTIGGYEVKSLKVLAFESNYPHEFFQCQGILIMFEPGSFFDDKPAIGLGCNPKIGENVQRSYAVPYNPRIRGVIGYYYYDETYGKAVFSTETYSSKRLNLVEGLSYGNVKVGGTYFSMALDVEFAEAPTGS